MENKKVFTVNPTVLMLLGATFAVSVTNNVLTALYAGLAITALNLICQIVVSLVKKYLSKNGQFAVVILLSAGLCSILEMLTHTYFAQIYSMMGIYISLMAVNLITLYRCEESAAVRGVGAAALDAVITGLCFTVSLFVIALLRELFGFGTFAGNEIAFLSSHTVPLLVRNAGGYIVLAIVMAVSNAIFPAERVSFGEGFTARALFEGTVKEDK